jgi:hypothetical protein
VVRINPVRLKVVLLGSKNFQQLARFGTWFVAAQNRVGGGRVNIERFWNTFADPLTPLMLSDTIGPQRTFAISKLCQSSVGVHHFLVFQILHQIDGIDPTEITNKVVLAVHFMRSACFRSN